MTERTTERALDLLERIVTEAVESYEPRPLWLDDARDLLRDAGRDPHDTPSLSVDELRKHLRPLPKSARGLDI